MLSFRQFTAMLLATCCILFTFPSAADDVVTGDTHLASYLATAGNDDLPGPWIAPGKAKETPEERRVRISMIADVIATQAPLSAAEHGWRWSTSDLALAAFTKTYYESGRFNIDIHNGHVRGDHGKSVCLGQIMFGGNTLVGTDRAATQRCIAEVMRHLIMHQRRCLNENSKPSPWTMAKVFAGYGTGYSCDPDEWMPKKDEHGDIVKDHWARNRAATWWTLRKKAMEVTADPT